MIMDYTDSSDEVKLGKLVMEMMGDPVAKKTLLKEYKRLHPDAQLPELEQEELLNKSITPLQAKIDELEGQLSADKISREEEQKAIAVMRKYEIEDLAPVRQFMADNGISTLESGARFYRMATNLEVPETVNSIHEALGNEELFKNPREWGRKVASQILNETGA